jgi:hypothetical protein
MAESNYGATMTKGGTSVGKVAVQDFPEIGTSKAPATHHGSGGVAESIPNGLISLGDVSLSIIREAGTLSAIHADIAAKSIEEIVINDGFDTMTFDGYYLSAKPEPADADSPDTSKLAVVVACTGAIVIAPA